MDNVREQFFGNQCMAIFEEKTQRIIQIKKRLVQLTTFRLETDGKQPEQKKTDYSILLKEWEQESGWETDPTVLPTRKTVQLPTPAIVELPPTPLGDLPHPQTLGELQQQQQQHEESPPLTLGDLQQQQQQQTLGDLQQQQQQHEESPPQTLGDLQQQQQQQHEDLPPQTDEEFDWHEYVLYDVNTTISGTVSPAYEGATTHVSEGSVPEDINKECSTNSTPTQSPVVIEYCNLEAVFIVNNIVAYTTPTPKTPALKISAPISATTLPSTPFVLKIRIKTSIIEVKNLNENSTIDELKVELFTQENLDCSLIKILKGFPPIPIDTANETLTLASHTITT